MEETYIISKHKQIVLIRETSILYILAVGSYSLFKIDTGEEHLVTRNLKACFGKVINKELFIRTHRSCYINKTCIKSIEKVSASKACIIIINGEKLPVSSKFIAELKAQNKLR